jgi:hypothetical protein
MGYESMRLLQLVFSLLLVVGAFSAGLMLGWHRWARPRRSDAYVPDLTLPPSSPVARPNVYPVPVRPDLFAPELAHPTEIDLTLPATSPRVMGERLDAESSKPAEPSSESWR